MGCNTPPPLTSSLGSATQQSRNSKPPPSVPLTSASILDLFLFLWHQDSRQIDRTINATKVEPDKANTKISLFDDEDFSGFLVCTRPERKHWTYMQLGFAHSTKTAGNSNWLKDHYNCALYLLQHSWEIANSFPSLNYSHFLKATTCGAYKRGRYVR